MLSNKKLWKSSATPPAEPCHAEVRLEDDTIVFAYWDGARWWKKGTQVLPKSWVRPETGEQPDDPPDHSKT